MVECGGEYTDEWTSEGDLKRNTGTKSREERLQHADAADDAETCGRQQILTGCIPCGRSMEDGDALRYQGQAYDSMHREGTKVPSRVAPQERIFSPAPA